MPISFSPSYEALFGDMLADVAAWKPRRGAPPSLTACWTECGDSYVPGEGLLVLGRATNGFIVDLTVDQLASADIRRQKLQEIRATAEGTPTVRPLSWVDAIGDIDPSKARKRALGGTIGSRSAFWRVTRALLKEMTPGLPAVGWSQHLAWGNLCKIAPNVHGTGSEGANPSWSLMKRQLDHCTALIGQEVRESRPRVVLVIAGRWWYNLFAPGLGLQLVPRDGAKYVGHVATEPDGRLWIFTERPEHRPQDAFVAELCGTYHEHRQNGICQPGV